MSAEIFQILLTVYQPAITAWAAGFLVGVVLLAVISGFLIFVARWLNL